jgi:hypothetical protein
VFLKSFPKVTGTHSSPPAGWGNSAYAEVAQEHRRILTRNPFWCFDDPDRRNKIKRIN